MPSAERLRPLVEAIDAGRVDPSAYDAIFDRSLREEEPSLGPFEIGQGAEEVLSRLIDELRPRLRAMRFTSDEARLRWAQGQVTPGVLGRLSPATIRARLTAALGSTVEDDA